MGHKQEQSTGISQRAAEWGSLLHLLPEPSCKYSYTGTTRPESRLKAGCRGDFTGKGRASWRQVGRQG